MGYSGELESGEELVLYSFRRGEQLFRPPRLRILVNRARRNLECIADELPERKDIVTLSYGLNAFQGEQCVGFATGDEDLVGAPTRGLATFRNRYSAFLGNLLEIVHMPGFAFGFTIHVTGFSVSSLGDSDTSS